MAGSSLEDSNAAEDASERSTKDESAVVSADDDDEKPKLSRGRGLTRKKSLGRPRSRSSKRNESVIKLDDDDDSDGPKIRRVRRVKGSGDSQRGSVTRIKVRRTKSGDGLDEEMVKRLAKDHLSKSKREEAENDHNGGNDNSDSSDEEVPVRRRIGRSKSSDGTELNLMRERELRGEPTRGRGRRRPPPGGGGGDDDAEAAEEPSKHAAENLRRLAEGALGGGGGGGGAESSAPRRGRDAPRRGVARTKSNHRERSMSPGTANRLRAQGKRPDADSSEEEGEIKKMRGGRRPGRNSITNMGLEGGPYFSITELREQSVEGLDYDNREKYLSPNDFQDLFGCTKEEYDEMPKWKQQKAKKLAELF